MLNFRLLRPCTIETDHKCQLLKFQFQMIQSAIQKISRDLVFRKVQLRIRPSKRQKIFRMQEIQITQAISLYLIKLKRRRGLRKCKRLRVSARQDLEHETTQLVTQLMCLNLSSTQAIRLRRSSKLL